MLKFGILKFQSFLPASPSRSRYGRARPLGRSVISGILVTSGILVILVTLVISLISLLHFPRATSNFRKVKVGF